MSEAVKPATAPTADEIRAMNIWWKLAAITAELPTVAKNLDVPTGGKNSYKAVSERDIIDAVKPLEEKYRIYSYPSEREILETDVLESEKTWNGNTTKTSQFFTRMRTTYTFVNIDNPEEKVTTTVFSIGIDSQDKGEGKAMTYGDKYALMKMYKISTGDDPDQDPSPDQTITRGKQQNQGYGRPPQQNQGYGQPQYQAPPQQNQQGGQNQGKPIICEGCGNVMGPERTREGTELTPTQVAAWSYNQFGKALCPKCRQAAQQGRQQ